MVRSKIAEIAQNLQFQKMLKGTQFLTLLNAGGGGIRPPYHINVVPRKMLKEKVANFL